MWHPRSMFRRRATRIGLLLSLCLAMCGLIFGRSLLLMAGDFLVVQDPPVKADAIIVLLGESSHERTDTAVSLFRDGYAPILVFPRAYRRTPILPLRDPSEYPLEDGGEDYKRRLLRAGVPESAIRLVFAEDVHDTATELLADALVLRTLNVHSVLLVSSANHSRRVSLIWRRIAPDIVARTIGAPNRYPVEWWTSARGRHAVTYEYGALVKEAFRRALGALKRG